MDVILHQLLPASPAKECPGQYTPPPSNQHGVRFRGAPLFQGHLPRRGSTARAATLARRSWKSDGKDCATKQPRVLLDGKKILQEHWLNPPEIPVKFLPPRARTARVERPLSALKLGLGDPENVLASFKRQACKGVFVILPTMSDNFQSSRGICHLSAVAKRRSTTGARVTRRNLLNAVEWHMVQHMGQHREHGSRAQPGLQTALRREAFAASP